MSLSADVKGRLSTLLGSRQDAIVKEWTALAARTLRGRQTEGELTHQINEIFGALTHVLATGEQAGVQGSDVGEARATLSELSRQRARQGFSATETATLVLALKEAMIGVLAAEGQTDVPADFVAFSGLVDELGLFTFESYAQAREES